MAFGYAPRCAGCVAVHAVNFLMIAGVWKLSTRVGVVPDRGTTDTPLSAAAMARLTLTPRQALSALTFSVVLIAGLWVYRGRHLAFQTQIARLAPYKTWVNAMRNDPAFLEREHLAQPRVEIPARRDSCVPSACPQLVVFTDYECPQCTHHSVTAVRQAVEAFGGHLDVVIRHFPLCGECNPSVRTAFHRNACEAARAAEAARLQGGQDAFRKMHEGLHAHSNRLGRDLYRRLAVRIGLDPERLIADMDSPAVREVIRTDIEAGMALGVTGTPAMFLDGRPVNLMFEGPTFWKAMARGRTSPHPDHRTVCSDPSTDREGGLVQKRGQAPRRNAFSPWQSTVGSEGSEPVPVFEPGGDGAYALGHPE